MDITLIVILLAMIFGALGTVAYTLEIAIKRLKEILEATREGTTLLRRQQIISSQCELGDAVWNEIQGLKKDWENTHYEIFYKFFRDRKVINDDQTVSYRIDAYATNFALNAPVCSLSINLERKPDSATFSHRGECTSLSLRLLHKEAALQFLRTSSLKQNQQI